MANSDRPQNDIEQIRSARFRKERESDWLKLEALLKRAEASGLPSLSYEEALEFTGHYRQAMNSLSVARSISLDKALLSYLERLCARAYMAVYAPQESITGEIRRLFVYGIPGAVRRSALPLAIGFLAMMLGGLTGYMLLEQDPSWYFTFVPAELADGRTPGASASYLRSTLFDTGERSGETLGTFASFLFSHNTQIAILTFALGIFICFPSFILTYYNGLLLGAFYGVFVDAGLWYEAFGWLSIHGVTELSAICVACAGGAKLGLAVLLPGDMTRRDALREHGRDAVKLMILAALMLVAAAIIEGFLRQLVQSTELRLAIGWGIGLLWLAWLMLSGRRHRGS